MLSCRFAEVLKENEEFGTEIGCLQAPHWPPRAVHSNDPVQEKIEFENNKHTQCNHPMPQLNLRRAVKLDNRQRLDSILCYYLEAFT